MREHRVFYFSSDISHISGFRSWAQTNSDCRDFFQLIEIGDASCPSQWRAEDLSKLLCGLDGVDNLYVIIDYLSLFKNPKELEEAADAIRRVILQFPEVDFVFDQSGVPDSWLNGIEFVLEQPRESSIGKKVFQGFHFFDKTKPYPFFFAVMDYDNLFDGTNLRWAVRRVHYDKLNANSRNFNKIQIQRSKNLALVIDDEQRQSRFNCIALYASGYRVIPVNTARMLLALSRGIFGNNDCVGTPQLIVRDFDLQFPDAEEKRDYNIRPDDDSDSAYDFYNVFEWNPQWEMTVLDKVEVPRLSCYDKMIDYIRDYRYYDANSPHWKIAENTEQFLFWKNNKDWHRIYVITNGHDHMDISEHGKYTPISLIKGGEKIKVSGMQKPVSGLYHPFFTKFRDENGKSIVEQSFSQTRYSLKDLNEYEIDKRRANHNHGVPVNIYGTVDEMLRRANDYYEKAHYVKSAVLAQEIIELLNGFHLQMMILAYQIKAKAENAISMDVVGADENELVLDALLRIEIIKQDIRRMVFPLFKGKSLRSQFKRRKKEHQLLEYIFSDCRKDCHDNEYFDVEAVFISAMAHLDEYDFGLNDIRNYLSHRRFLWKRKKLDSKR